MRGPWVTDEGLKHLLKLTEPTELRAIGLGRLKISDGAVRELAKLPHLKNIYFSAIPITDQTIEAILQRGTLYRVEIHSTQATRSCFPAILKNAKVLLVSLRGIALRDDDLRRIVELKELQAFDLWGPSITNESVRNLEPLSSLYNLHIIGCPQVDDFVFDHLASNRHLKVLSLANIAKITDAGLLKVKKKLSMLETLNLEKCAAITDDGVARLRAALPKLIVVWDGDAKK